MNWSVISNGDHDLNRPNVFFLSWLILKIWVKKPSSIAKLVTVEKYGSYVELLWYFNLSFCREQYTLALLNKFKTKLNNIKSTQSPNDDDEGTSMATSKDNVDDEELNTDKWMVGATNASIQCCFCILRSIIFFFVNWNWNSKIIRSHTHWNSMIWTQFWQKMLQPKKTIGMQMTLQILKIHSTNESEVRMDDAIKTKTVTGVDDRNTLTSFYI